MTVQVYRDIIETRRTIYEMEVSEDGLSDKELFDIADDGDETAECIAEDDDVSITTKYGRLVVES